MASVATSSPVAVAAAWLGRNHVITREGLIFSQTAIVTFGGAYAVLAYVAQRAVEDRIAERRTWNHCDGSEA